MAAFLVTGCSREPEVRYRVVLNMTDQGTERSASTVWSWRLRKPTAALATPYSGEFRGQALALRLASGRIVYAILRGANGDQNVPALLPERVFGDLGRGMRGEPKRFGSDRIEDLADIGSRVGERREINCGESPDLCPMLVTFRDPSDPRSLEVVDPGSPEETLGAGVTADGIVVEITDEAVGPPFSAPLPSLGRGSGFTEWRTSLPRGDPRRHITLTDFVGAPR
jgi:hypothetical protein